MTVPEAAVDEDDCLVFAQYYVGGAWQAFDVYAVAVALGVQIMSHDQLGFGVLALDARHALVPLLCGHSVCHDTKILFSLNIVHVILEKPLGTGCLDMSCVYYIFATLGLGNSGGKLLTLYYERI